MKVELQNAILLVLVLALLLTVFSVSALAYSKPPKLPFVTASTLGTDGISISTQSGIRKVGVYSDIPVYICYGATSGSSPTYIASQTQGATFYNNERGTITSYSCNTYHSSTGLYYINLVNVSPDYKNPEIPSYSNLNNAMAAILDSINNPEVPPEPVTTPLEYTLPPGNVAYIPIPDGMSQNITYTLTTTYYMAFGNNDTSRINQVVTVMSALPSQSNNIAPSSPKIPWTNNGSVNLLGISANKIYQGSIPANYGGQYLVVVNPMTMPSESGLIGGEIYTNGSINISVSAVSGSPYVYPMTESLVLNPGDDITSESSYGDSGYTYEVDPETGEIIWTDPDGGTSAPVAGGNNPMPTPNTIFDWLRNISQQLSDFLRGPVQAVQVVVSAIRDFMGSFTQLYQWLPSPVYSLITSALMIALTIGVIKIFV